MDAKPTWQLIATPPRKPNDPWDILLACCEEEAPFRANIGSQQSRQKLLRDITVRFEQLDTDDTKRALSREMEKLASAHQKRLKKKSNAKKPAKDEPRESQADRLVEIARTADLFHTPDGHDSVPYATFKRDEHFETFRLDSKGFERWLGQRYYVIHKKSPSEQALKEALGVISGIALHDGPEREVHIRLGEFEGAIYLDLGDSEWRVVRIDSDGWQVIGSTEAPVRFKRSRGTLPMAEPARGGDVNDLRDYLNMPSPQLDDQFMLLVGFLIMALMPRGPYPILVVNGEQGSAKTTLCKMARALIDPAKAPLRHPPTNERDLMIGAVNSRVCAYDNLSGVKQDLSDALCSLSTGAGFATRELYSDGDEAIFEAARPVMLNGINDLTGRADLADRAIHLHLPTIPPSIRQSEDTLWAGFEQAKPTLLGALLDAVCASLANQDSVYLESMPRMADFAITVIAAEGALGWEERAFLSAYENNRLETHHLAVEHAAIGPALLELLNRDGGVWRGTTQDLLHDLRNVDTPDISSRRDYPQTPKGMSNALGRLAPNLRALGIEVSHATERTNRGRLITIQKIEDSSSLPSHDHFGDDSDGSDDEYT